MSISFEGRRLIQADEFYPFFIEVDEAIKENNPLSRTYAIDLNGRDMVNFDLADKADNVIIGKIRETVQVSVGIAAVYRALPMVKNERRCDERRSLEECKSECRFTVISKLCNCTPTSQMNFGHYEGEDCTLTKYNNCPKFNGYPFFPCMDACLDRCTSWKYLIEETVRGISY